MVAKVNENVVTENNVNENIPDVNEGSAHLNIQDVNEGSAHLNIPDVNEKIPKPKKKYKSTYIKERHRIYVDTYLNSTAERRNNHNKRGCNYSKANREKINKRVQWRKLQKRMHEELTKIFIRERLRNQYIRYY